jgi:hypothetical protein
MATTTAVAENTKSVAAIATEGLDGRFLPRPVVDEPCWDVRTSALRRSEKFAYHSVLCPALASLGYWPSYLMSRGEHPTQRE